MKKQIPNIITLANLFSGCIAIVMAFQGQFSLTVMFVILAAVFDFFDGFTARLLKVSSNLGVELDSLADVVSFGVAPAATVFALLTNFLAYSTLPDIAKTIIPYLAFLIPVFSAYRLAKFNIDTRQTTSFLGLPTPANGLFWVSYAYAAQSYAPTHAFILYITLALILILSILMISEVPMFSLKFKKLQFKGNEPQFIIIILMIAFVAIWKISGIALGILAYILISFLVRKRNTTPHHHS